MDVVFEVTAKYPGSSGPGAYWRQRFGIPEGAGCWLWIIGDHSKAQTWM